MSRKCNARTRNGGRCSQPAGHQTIHPGVGRCKFHEDSDPEFPYKYASTKIPAGYGICRSDRELRIYRYLDRSNRISTYWIEPYDIGYLHEGQRLKYLPDILVEYRTGLRKLVEIKSIHDYKKDQNIAKYIGAKLFLQCHPDIHAFAIWVVELVKRSSKELPNRDYTLEEISV